MWIIFYILEPTSMTPKKTVSTLFFIQAHYFSDLYNFVFVLAFVFVMFLVFEKLEK